MVRMVAQGEVRRVSRKIGSLAMRLRRGASRLVRRSGPDVDRRLQRIEGHVRGIERTIKRVERYESGHLRTGRLDYEPVEIHMRLGSFPEFQRMRSCASEPWTIQWIEEWLEQDDVLYDIGANVGAYSLVAARSPKAGARVFAFEPVYSTFAALTENVIINGLADRVAPIPVALGSRTALDTLNLRILEAGGARHLLGDATEDSVHAQPVLNYRLDDLVQVLGLPGPTHIKLDVDGNELDVLDGAPRILASAELRSLLCELDHDVAERIETYLGKQGFALKERFQRVKAGPEQPPAYGLFVRQ